MSLDMIDQLRAAKPVGNLPGEIAAGRFALRPVHRSDEGLIEMYSGDRRVAEATHGAGVYEAVVTTLAERG